jgi:hypothetical protein
MNPASDLVEPLTGSETTMTPAADLVPPMTTSDVVPAKPASDLVTTKTASDLVEPVDLIPNKMSGTSYFYKASSRKLSYVKNTNFNMVLGSPPWSDSKVLKPPASEKETSKHSNNDTTATTPPDANDLKPLATETVTTTMCQLHLLIQMCLKMKLIMILLQPHLQM